MTFRILTEKEIEMVYYHDMQRDFPKSEVKPLKTILNLRKQEYYQCYGIFQNEKFCAYLFLVWDHKNFAMLDYFAVLPEFRGHGIGGKALLRVSFEMKKNGFSGILFEIERISQAENKEQEKMRTRRKHFYLEAGCRESGLKSEIFGVGYEILYLLLEERQVNCDLSGNDRAALQELERAYTEIYHRMVKKEYYDENVLIHVD